LKIPNIISNFVSGFITGLIFIAVLLSNNTGFSLVDSFHISSLPKAETQRLQAENRIAGKYGSIHKKRSTIRKFLRAHKTKRKKERPASVYTPSSEASDLFGSVVKTQVKVNFVYSYLLSSSLLRGPPSSFC
jgi:hypothetical protein